MKKFVREKTIFSKKLTKTLFIMTAILIAALFLGSAASAGVATVNATKKTVNVNKISNSKDGKLYIPSELRSRPEQIAQPLRTVILSEGFEDETFPPTDWSMIQTNTGTQGGVPCYWHRTTTSGYYHSGAAAAGLWWSPDHQDEWLISPSIDLTTGYAAAQLSFWTYGWEGSIYDDHYYVKVSTDNGTTWTAIFDLSDLTGDDWNAYDYPYTIDLTDYIGETIKLAWHAIDCNDPGNPNYPGLWYVWFIDDVQVTASEPGDRDMAVLDILSPASGNVQTFTPVVKVKNEGTTDELSVPVDLTISKLSYNILLEEYFEPFGTFPPTGWTRTNTKWDQQNTNNAGGTAPEARFYFSPSETGDFRLYTYAIDTTGYTNLALTFKHSVNHYTTPYTLKVETSTNAATWNTVWSIDPTGSIGPTDVMIPLTTTDGVGSSTFYISFTFSGYSWNINYWYVDNVKLFISSMTQEYSQTEYVNVDIGETLDVPFALDWIPADLQVSENVYIDYLAEAEIDISGDVDPSDNMKTEVATLYYGFFHDVKVDSIISPADGYAVKITPEAVVSNNGQYDESITVTMEIEKKQVTGTPEDFETTNGGYVPSGNPSTLWEWGTPTYGPSSAHSGVKLWGTNLAGDYPASANVQLTTPSVVLPAGSPFLMFWHWYDTEVNYDGGNVKISIDDGATWAVITPLGGYTGTANTANPLYPQPIFTGHNQKYWELEEFDLEIYAGETAKFRFDFGSDSSVQYPGWYIDDVLITNINWIEEVTESIDLDIDVGQTTNIVFSDWTPSDITLPLEIFYRAKATATIAGWVPVLSEGFDTYVPGYYDWPTGWAEVITNTNSNWYIDATYTRANCQELNAGELSQDEWLISPTIDLTGITAPQLSFYRYFSRATTGGDSYVQVWGSIDDGTTWTILINNYTASVSAATQVFDVSSWAANQALVKIAWHFVSTADATMTDVFYFDDLYIGVNWGPYGDNPPIGWTILDYGSVPGTWNNNDWHRYSYGGTQGQVARVYYSPVEYQNEWLISPSVDCSALITVNLEFWHYFYRYSANTYGFVNGSIDGGVTFPYNIVTYNAASDGPAIRTFDISSWAAGQSNVKIRFQYKDYDGLYWYVDDFKIKSDTTTIYSQNFEGSPIYTTSFNSNYIPASWGSNGWTATHSNWAQVNTANAGGTAPELRFYYSPSFTGDSRMYTGPIDTTGETDMQLTFKHFLDHYTTPYTLKVETSTDGLTWNTVWSIDPTGNVGPETITIDLTTLDGIGSSTFRISFTFSGYSFNIDYWYIDDVVLSAYSTVPDGNPSDNVLTKYFALTYIHDTGVIQITKPTYPLLDKDEGDIIFHQRVYTPTEDWTFYTSANYNGADYLAQDDFWDLEEPIGDVEWWGLAMIYSGGWIQGNPDGMTFEIIFYEDAGGQPGDIVQNFPGLQTTAVNTGVTYSGFYMFYWALELPENVNLENGWMAIRSTSCPDNSWLLWGGSPEGNQNMWHQGASPPQVVDDCAYNLSAGATGGGGNWPPGTYQIRGVVQNLGSYTEYDIPVNAKIWKQVSKADELFYEDNYTIPVLAPGETDIAYFADVTFENEPEDEGNFKLEMKTMLPSDDRPTNDKKTLSFVIQFPDVTPPVTTHELTGTMGLNNWYVSNVVLTLTANDPPSGFGYTGGKWPTGVNHTYYKINTGTWQEYTIPVTISTDGQYNISYYSVDKADNVETTKWVVFKMDKTGPQIELTVEKVGFRKWKLTADASDVTSGINIVEFYVDDALLGNISAPGPYIWNYQGTGHSAQAIAYDLAGNTAISLKVSPSVEMQGQQSQLVILKQKIPQQN